MCKQEFCELFNRLPILLSYSAEPVYLPLEGEVRIDQFLCFRVVFFAHLSHLRRRSRYYLIELKKLMIALAKHYKISLVFLPQILIPVMVYFERNPFPTAHLATMSGPLESFSTDLLPVQRIEILLIAYELKAPISTHFQYSCDA